MSAAAPFVEAQGARIPALGLGTWNLRGPECAEAVADALALGYRHIDTAAMYGNEREVGQGLRASGAKREEVFVTTKVWSSDIGQGDLQRSAEASLTRLQMASVDLLLIHWPNPSIPLKDSIAALCDAKRRGLARHIGVSNFSIDLLRRAIALSSEPIIANQCESHPRHNQAPLIKECRRSGVAFVSYRPLGKGALASDPLLKRIAAAHGKSAAQVCLRWHVQQGLVAIPKAARREHLAENFAIFDFALSEKEMAAISAI
ncbi:MAG TPA: aldo/keto reductase [Roseiarcus sp.]|nr:aldo/keto reductase [Roseiarcus sp.]